MLQERLSETIQETNDYNVLIEKRGWERDGNYLLSVKSQPCETRITSSK